jgi:hypothetical protein
MTEKSFFAGFGGQDARKGTRAGERVSAGYGGTACPQVKAAVKNKLNGGIND